MNTVTLNQWINPNLYNQFPAVEEARKVVTEEEQTNKARELTESIPEINNLGVGLIHNHWRLRENENIIGSVEDKALHSKPQCYKEGVCPTAWVSTKRGLCAFEGITNPTEEVLETSRKVTELAEKVNALFPLSDEEEFSKVGVGIDVKKIIGNDHSFFLEENADGISTIKPITEEEMKTPNNILTFVAVKPDGKKTAYTCHLVCFSPPDGHRQIHIGEPWR